MKLPVVNFLPKTRLGFNLSALTFALAYFFYLKFKRGKEDGIIYTIDLDQFSFFLIPFLGRPYFFETHAIKKANFIYRFFLRRVRGIVAINQRIKSYLVHTFNLGAEKILVFPNGIDLKMFGSIIPSKDAKRQVGLPESRYAVLYIGRFYDWKGLYTLVPAVEILGAGFTVYLVGGTKHELIDILGRERLPENLICLGPKNYREIPLWIHAADLLLLLGTRKSDYSYTQTSPMKLFEYMAARRPIVASRTPAIEEVVSEKEVIFAEPDSPADLARAIRSVFQDQEGFKERINNAWHKVQNFSWDKRVERILKLITSSS